MQIPPEGSIDKKQDEQSRAGDPTAHHQGHRGHAGGTHFLKTQIGEESEGVEKFGHSC